MSSLRTLLVAILLIALPLQGVAAYAPMIACTDGHAAGSDGHPHPAQADTTHGSTVHDHQGGGEPAESPGGHSCCHHVVSAVTPALLALTPVAPPIPVPRVSLLSTLYIPELPQRPPRV